MCDQGRDNKWDGTINEIRRLISLRSYVYIKPGYIASRPGNSKGNMFHISTSSRNKKRPDLINFSLYIIRKGMLDSLTFLRISLPELLGKTFSQFLQTY